MIAEHAQRLAVLLRRHREAHNLSLGELSRLTGLSKTSITRLESGAGNPSLETLWRIGEQLGMTIGQLLDEPEPSPTRLLPAGSGPAVESTAGMRGRLLQTDASRHRTEVFELDLPDGAAFAGDSHDPATRELVYCVSGSVTCGPAAEPLALGPGDAASFDGAVPHTYTAGPGGGRFVLVMSYPAP